MVSFTCVAAYAAALLMLPVLILLWITETKQQRAKRWRKQGRTYKVIAERLKVSPTTARKYCLN